MAGPNAANTETELKLRISDEELARLKASPWWRALPPGGKKELHSVYFDTPKQTLRKLGVSLRTRNKNDRIEQTVKMDGADALNRHEWTAMIPDPVPDPSLVIDPALPVDFRALSAADLAPAFKVDLERETRLLTPTGSEIELALDDGVVESGKTKSPLRELELELLSGDARALIAEARRIIDIAGGRVHLTSKADRGYALSGASPAPWRKSAPLSLSLDADVGAAVQSIILQCIDHLTANDECARDNTHIEGVHQCRIAVRRLRSAFRLFRPALPKTPFEHLDAELKWFAATLGAARDLDVLEADLIAPAMRAVDQPADIEPLLRALQEMREKAYENVSEAIHSARYSRLLLDLFSVAALDDWRNGNKKALNMPVKKFGAGALSAMHSRLLAKGKRFKKLSVPKRHALRLTVKKMRYTSEFFIPLYAGDKKAKRFAKTLSTLQDGLGSLNDVAVAEVALARLVKKAAAANSDARADLSYASGCVLGWHRRRAADVNEELAAKWSAFSKSKPFWA